MTVNYEGLIGAVTSVKVGSEQISRFTTHSHSELSNRIPYVANLVRGKNSALPAIGAMQIAVESLSNVRTTMKLLEQACDEYLKHLVQ